jgi:(S)-2-hydroxyglutarate dehydrogenase
VMNADILVVGAGVLGLSLALALRERFVDQRVCVIDKDRCGAHASGRNSGVLHAGFYYGEDSLRAKFSVAGRRRMVDWCDEHGVAVRRCGKLVVARDASEHAGLDELLRRASRNGVQLESLSAEEARAIEPRVKTFERALFSPSTASVDPEAVMVSLATAARARGIEIVEGEGYLGRTDTGVHTTAGRRSVGFVVNAAGVYADRIASDFGFGSDYGIVPFRGLYLYGGPSAGPLACHIYPVPDLKMPFLGVHFTVTSAGQIKIGPTATPALGREHYGGLSGLKWRDLIGIGARQGRMWLHNASFRRLAAQELRHQTRGALVAEAGALVSEIRPEDFRRWGRPGIRAQLVHRHASTLVTDFVVEGDAHSLHILNGISPGFTCSLAFADWVVGGIG